MTKINRAPTPEKFANEWTKGFAAAVRSEANSRDRLTEAGAKRISERDDALAVYGDNAQNFLEKVGQKSVAVDKLIGRGHDYARATAENAAGKDGKLSLLDIRNLPADLQTDALKLRGK